MEVASEGKDARLTVEVTEGEFIEYPSLNLLVTVSDEGFCEARSYAWVTLKDYKDFVAALRQCEQTRRGHATLSGMSPSELELVVESSDKMGHFCLRYRLGKTSFTSRTVQAKAVMGGFDLDVELFDQTVSGFADLLPVPET